MSVGDTMKKFITTIVICLLAITTVFSLVACNGADANKKEAGLYYKVLKGDDFYTVYDYVAEDGKTVLDLNEYNKDGVVIGKIASGAFKNNDTIKEIIVPETVEEIASGAFSNMKALEKITLPFIGKNANADTFYGESAPSEEKSIDAQRTLAYLFGTERYAGGASITSNYGAGSATYYVPATLQEVTITCEKEGRDAYGIPMYAFNGFTAISKVNLIGNIDVIGVSAFDGCHALSSINIPASVKEIGEGAFCTAPITRLDFEEGSNLEIIGEKAFYGCRIETITIPKSVKVIKEGAFSECQWLKNVYFEDGMCLERIEGRAFYGASQYDNVTIPKSVQYIGVSVYYNVDEVYYEGTVEQWETIVKESAWIYSSFDIRIYCSDQTIIIDR